MTQVIFRQSMKTSSRIALQFTFWIAIISGILLWILNTVFMYWWIRSETQNITQYVVLKNLQPRNPYTDTLQRQERVMAFSDQTFRPEDLASFWWIKRLRLFDSRRWIVWKSTNYYVLFDVSQNINRQLGLLSISAISWWWVVFLSFIFGRFFVRKSLRDLRILWKKIRSSDITRPSWTLKFNHLPENDEINSIARAIENLESRIMWYYSNLRQFVWNVSHELKTPLMVMSSELDVTQRTKQYEDGIKNLKWTVSDMQSMIDALLTLTRLQSQDSIEKKQINVYDITRDASENLEKKYKHKPMHITYSENVKDFGDIQWNEQLVKIMIHNIIDNARKYAPEQSWIHITIDKDYIEVENTWHISQDIIENMRTPFWQADKNRWDWVGIWLSLVAEIIRLHGWGIWYSCINNKVICTISLITT